MNVPRTLAGKIGLGLIFGGQAIVVGGLWTWTRALAGAPWASRPLVMGLSAGGAALYFSGRVLQAIARRRQNREPS